MTTAAIEEAALYQELQRVIRVKGINGIDMRGGNHAGEARIGRDTRQGEQNGSLSCPCTRQPARTAEKTRWTTLVGRAASYLFCIVAFSFSENKPALRCVCHRDLAPCTLF